MLIAINMIMINFVNASNACIAVYFPDGTADSKCVDVTNNLDGKGLLDLTDFDILWTPESIYGQMICKINRIGTDVGTTGYCEYSGSFWNFAIKDGDKWGHSPVGLNGGDSCWNRDLSFNDWSKIVHYCVRDNDLIGFAFGEAGAVPEMLKINNIEIKVDGKINRITEGETIENVEPESKIKIELELKNLYSKETDIEMKNVQVEAVIKDIDDGSNLRVKSKQERISAGDEEVIDLEFEIPLKVEQGEYNLILTVSGEDEKGILYKKETKYSLNLEKETHKLKFTNLSIYPEEIDCGNSAILIASVLNLGIKKENVQLIISNAELRISLQEKFSLNNDPFRKESEFEKEYQLVPKNVKPGVYPISVKINYTGGEKEQMINLNIKECAESLEIKNEGDIIELGQKEITEKSFIEKDKSLILIISIIFIGGIALVFFIIKNKKKK